MSVCHEIWLMQPHSLMYIYIKSYVIYSDQSRWLLIIMDQIKKIVVYVWLAQY